MIRSMTAFAKSTYEGKEFNLEVFIRTYNHRYLDSNLKLPLELIHLEGELRNLVSRYVSRGRIEMTVRASFLKEGIHQVLINRGVVSKLMTELKLIQEENGIRGDIDLASVMRIPGLIEVQTDIQKISRDVLDEIKEVVETCLKSLVQMRQQEGKSLASDILERLKALLGLVSAVEEAARDYPAHVRQTLEKSMKEILSGTGVDNGRLFEEVAYYAERSDITEELVRLKSHVQQAQSLTNAQEPAGRKLDFLLQEILREINTIGSKCDLLPVSQAVIEMKTEVEKIREQAQNVE
ncbi:MAG TPA: YicC/YloC family endoribonuclease [Acidobacteriota bacterium]|nr:YicC/YloC family endoribonuclease [Acidobacteriota bacterium]